MSYYRCKACGKNIPVMLAPYNRVSQAKSGVWIPDIYDICTCDFDAYEFYVIGIARERNKRRGLDEDAWIDEVKDKEEYKEVIKKVRERKEARNAKE